MERVEATVEKEEASAEEGAAMEMKTEATEATGAEAAAAGVVAVVAVDILEEEAVATAGTTGRNERLSQTVNT